MSHGFDSPYQPPSHPMGGDPDAASKVAGPAIGLIVLASLGIFLQLISALSNLFVGGVGLTQGSDEAIVQGLLQGGLGLVMNCVGALVGAFIIFGALKMKNLQSYGLAMAAAILAIIPCLSPCCLLGLPIGIWSLVVLMDDNVKRSFHG
jgi:hypothetical protein